MAIDVLPPLEPASTIPSTGTSPTAAGPTFHLRGESMSYVLAVTRHGHLEHIHFGASLGPLTDSADLAALRVRAPSEGPAIAYTPEDTAYRLDNLPLDWSGLGKGDMRAPTAEFRQPDGTFVSDFRYVSHEVREGVVPARDGLPTAVDGAATLTIELADGDARLTLHYTVFPDTDTVTRRAVLTHAGGEGTLVIRKLMSQQVDLPNRPFDLVTFDGAWISEGHRHTRPVMPGTYVNSSITGFSSNLHNPGVLLAERGASEDRGEVYAFNLIYSGNHYTSVELSQRELVRVMAGINPTGFEWTLGPGEAFETPEATLTWSDRGFNGVSDALHRFVNRHIVRGEWAGHGRPILFNNWEATYFNINHRTVVRMARQAARLGAELFVLDDGWFGSRSDDHRALGDWVVNPKKLPKGLAGLGDDVRAAGLDFGLWFEPEMVNRDSDLYRAHPDWAIAVPGRTPSEGRHQLVLDLSREDVRDYLVERVGSLIDEAGVTYVKWDANRSLSDLWSANCAPGELGHRYILGLYDLFRRIFEPRPGVLLESCSSGGNRFDLGMLCFSPQIWTSDDTDPIERLDIQLGLSYLYPQSTMGAHVSASPSAQTLRRTPLTTRFNVAALGVLGYELDPGRFSPAERREVKRQIAFYKRHRRLLQFGRLRRYEPANENQRTVSVSEGDAHVVGQYQLRAHAAQPAEALPLPPLKPERRYRVTSRPQSVDLADFGALVEHVLPLPVRGDGRIMREVGQWKRYPDGDEAFEATGAVLRHLRLHPQYEGTGAEAGQRVLADHGSRLYLVEPVA